MNQPSPYQGGLHLQTRKLPRSGDVKVYATFET